VEGSSAWFSCFVGALALLAIGYFAWRTYGGGGASPPQAGPSPVAVVVATATARVWQTQVSAVGTLVAMQGVEVTSEVPGMVSAIHFQSGESVRAGALLLELDATTDRARLASLVAQFEQACADDTRNRRLVERGLISTAEAEQSATTVETLAAQVQEQRTLINKKRIEAPFAGELGIRLVNLGQFIAAGKPIVPLQSIAPIYVNFALPEARYPAITRGQAVEVTVDAFHERQFAGTVNAISPEVSEATHNFDVQALLPNEARLLRPGMFAHVTVALAESHDVVTVPATAISYSPQGDAVFIVVEPPAVATPEGPTEPPAPPTNLPTVRRTLVQVGERRGHDVAILAGVAAGERVVTAGQMKLYNGAPASISSADAGTHAPTAQPQERSTWDTSSSFSSAGPSSPWW
jgi:membrane fusion protein (multidrug efflux system)